MIEVVFSDSAKGALKLAQRYDENQFAKDGPTAYIGDWKPTEALLRMWRGKPLGGNPEDVAGLSFMLDMGDISGDLTGEKRAEELYRLWGFAFDNQEEGAFYEMFQSSVHDLLRVKAAAASGEKLRVWCDDTPASVCGLRHLMWEIRECDCELCVVELPRYLEEDGTLTFSGWHEVMPGHFYQFAPQERALRSFERRRLELEWRSAAKENAPLRVVINGRLTSVDEDFYDPLLRACMTEEPMTMGRLIGKVLGKHPVGVSDSWYARRIRAMIDSGELKVVDAGDGSHPYSMQIQKV